MVLIAVSGYGLERDQHQACAAGIKHYLVKTVDTAALLHLIDNAMGSGTQLVTTFKGTWLDISIEGSGRAPGCRRQLPPRARRQARVAPQAGEQADCVLQLTPHCRRRRRTSNSATVVAANAPAVITPIGPCKARPAMPSHASNGASSGKQQALHANSKPAPMPPATKTFLIHFCVRSMPYLS